MSDLLHAGATLIDVRTPAEYQAAHVTGARLMPLDQFDATALALNHADAPIYLLCESGKRAQRAAAQLQAAGHTQAIVVEGGTAAALAAGVAVIRARGAISLELRCASQPVRWCYWAPCSGCAWIPALACRLCRAGWSLRALRTLVAWACFWRNARGTVDLVPPQRSGRGQMAQAVWLGSIN